MWAFIKFRPPAAEASGSPRASRAHEAEVAAARSARELAEQRARELEYEGEDMGVAVGCGDEVESETRLAVGRLAVNRKLVHSRPQGVEPGGDLARDLAQFTGSQPFEEGDM